MYHPTEDEFADPSWYIASIRAEAEEFGGRIVPPSSFKCDSIRTAASFAFKTRVQTVKVLQLRLKKGKNRSFPGFEYADFMQSRGQSVTRRPVYGGKKQDLQALYDNVVEPGRIRRACAR